MRKEFSKLSGYDFCMISMNDFLMGRDVRFPLSDELKANALDMLGRLASLEDVWGDPLVLTSGYRPSQINQQTPGAAPKSLHETCQAVDLHDPEWDLYDFLATNTSLLKQFGLYMESKSSALNHVHLQSVAPKSGKLIFIA